MYKATDNEFEYSVAEWSFEFKTRAFEYLTALSLAIKSASAPTVTRRPHPDQLGRDDPTLAEDTLPPRVLPIATVAFCGALLGDRIGSFSLNEPLSGPS